LREIVVDTSHGEGGSARHRAWGEFKERENMTRQETESEVRASDNPGPRRMLNEKQVLEIVPVSTVTL